MGKMVHKKEVYSGGTPYKFVEITEAEYNALSESEKLDPTKLYLISDKEVVSAQIDDTDTSTGKVWSSDKVNSELETIQTEVDGNTDAISALNSRINVTTFSAAVDISNYTSYANSFVCPTDGYLRLVSGSAVNDYVIAQVSASNADAGFNISAKTRVTNYSEYNSVYVRKGMKCYVLAKTGSDSTLSFRGFA